MISESGGLVTGSLLRLMEGEEEQPFVVGWVDQRSGGGSGRAPT